MVKHKLISAPAGSGKTRELVERYLSLIKLNFKPQNIVAITYTNKAASEMKERVFRLLSKEFPDKWQEFRKDLQTFRISTIHSFFASLLRRVAMEQELDPDFEVLPSNQYFEELLNLAIDEVFREILSSSEAWMIERLIKDLSYWNLISFLREKLKRFILFVEIAEDKAKEPFREDYISGKLSREAFNSPIIDFFKIAILEEETVKALSRIFLKVLNRFNSLKKELGYLHFDDFEYYVYKALKEYEINSLLLYFNEHVIHLLIDEFQDTSFQQWKIIRQLIDDWFSGVGISEVFNSSLFIVGDPKQSIYRFRGAEVENFRQVKELFLERVASSEGRKYFDLPEERRENYRSLPRIIEFVNAYFRRIWGEDYTEAKPHRRGKGRVEIIKISKDKTRREAKEKEAEAIIGKIFEIMKNPDKYKVYDITEKIWREPRLSDIALLFRKKTHMDLFEKKLRERGIKYISERGTGFFHKPETNFLRNLAGYLSTGSIKYLLALMVTPVFGFSLREIKEMGQKLIATKKLPYIFEAAERKDLEPLSSVLYRLCEKLELFRYFNLPSQVANIEKFLSLVEQEESQTGILWKEIFHSLQAYAEEKEGEYVLPGYQDCLRLLTVHLAKGLEFPIVFVTGFEEFFSGEGVRSSSVTIGKEVAVKIPWFEKLKKEDLEKLKYYQLLEQDREKDEEEALRILYVALTRARDHLFISGVMEDSKKEIYLDYLLEVAKELEIPVYQDYLPPLFKFELGEEKKEREEFLEELREESFIMEARASSELPPEIFLEKERFDALRFGTIFHRILQELAEGTIKLSEVSRRTRELGGDAVKVESHLKKLEESGLLNSIVLFKPSLEEYSFTLIEDQKIIKAKVDKILFKEDEIWIVDYKTDLESPEEIVEKYRQQLKVYMQAARLFWNKNVRGFLLLTSHGKLVEVQ